MGNVKLKGSLGCSDHDVVELKILKAVRRVHSKLVTLDLRRADFGLLRDLLGKVPWLKPSRDGWGTQWSLYCHKVQSPVFLSLLFTTKELFHPKDLCTAGKSSWIFYSSPKDWTLPTEHGPSAGSLCLPDGLDLWISSARRK